MFPWCLKVCILLKSFEACENIQHYKCKCIGTSILLFLWVSRCCLFKLLQKENGQWQGGWGIQKPTRTHDQLVCVQQELQVRVTSGFNVQADMDIQMYNSTPRWPINCPFQTISFGYIFNDFGFSSARTTAVPNAEAKEDENRCGELLVLFLSRSLIIHTLYLVLIIHTLYLVLIIHTLYLVHLL